MGKFRLQSKAAPDAEQLLTPKKSGIFGKQNHGVRSEDVGEKPKRLKTRLSAVFKQHKREEPIDLFDDATAPPSPEFDVMVLTTQRSHPHSPQRHIEESCTLTDRSSPIREHSIKSSRLSSNDGETVLSELTGTMNKASESHQYDDTEFSANMYSKEVGGFDAEASHTLHGTLVEKMCIVMDDACGGKRSHFYAGDHQRSNQKETEAAEWSAPRMAHAMEDELHSGNDGSRPQIEEEEMHDNFELVLSPSHFESSAAPPGRHEGIDRTVKDLPFEEEEKKEEDFLSNDELKSQVYESVFGVDHVTLAEEERKKAYVKAKKNLNADADKSKRTRLPSFVKRFKQNMGLSRKGSDKKNETPSSDARSSDSLIVKGATRDTIQAEQSPENTHPQNPKTKQETGGTIRLQQADNEKTEKNENAEDGFGDIRRAASGPMSSPDAKPDKQSMDPSREAISLARLRSAPTMLATPPKKTKRVWKSAKDEKTGAVYYYHRLTRQTTWTRPPDAELHDTVQDEAARKATNESKSAESLRKKSERDFDPTVWETKQEIMQILKKFPLPKETSLDNLFEQYAGREQQLLAQFKDLVESRPFDEPYQALTPERSQLNQSSGSIQSSDLGAGTPLKNRERTAVSATTRVSEKTGTTDATDKIRNTSNKQGLISKIREKNRSTMSTGSISSAADLPPEKSSGYPGIAPGRIPSKIPAVTRERSLQVEVFSQDGHAKAETYNGKRRIIGHDIDEIKEEDELLGHIERKPALKEDDDSYNADHEETNDERGAETASEKATDSISALSDLDGEISVNKESIEKAKRRALAAAVEREDWDLATALSEGMRQVKSSLQIHESREWTQTELDRFISDNDWDAVSKHIAKMRDQFMPKSANEQPISAKVCTAANTEEMDSNEKLAAAPRSKFGALSQLQHSELHSISSWDRSSSEYDSDSTDASRSYDSEEDPGYVSLSMRRAANPNFEC